MAPAPEIPGYRVIGVLRTGGFATVYRSWQHAVGREVAVKIDNRVLIDERDRRRFVREVTAAGRLSGHPHVIDVYDAGTLADGRPYMVMELCPAGSLNDALRRHGPMNAAQVRDIGVRIGDALAAAHAAGVLHRDIKPANILVNRFGLVGLSDFGLASIMAAEGEQSTTREALTPAYASPETLRCEEPTVAADIYSLAATLYALLAGRPPHFPADGRSPGIAIIIALRDGPLDDVPGTPPELMAILRRCLAVGPAARPPSAAALRDALAALPVHHGISAQPGQSVQPGGPPQSGGPQPGRSAQPGRPAQAVRQPAPRAVAPPAMHAMPAGPAGPAVAPPPPLPVAPPPPLPRRGAPPGPGRAGVPAGAALRGPGRGGARGAAAPAVPARRPRPVMLVVAAVAGLALLGIAAVVGAQLIPHGATSTVPPAASSSSGFAAGPATAPGAFGIPVVASGCPAASVPAAGARCPRDPECWHRLVVISGNVTASSMPCTRPHAWQTFAIAILPASVRTFDQNVVEHSPTVDAVCSMRVLLASRLGAARQIPRGSWQVRVMPPDEAAFNGGARAYRCVAHRFGGADPSSSEFGPRADRGGRGGSGNSAHGGPGSGTD